MSRNGILILGGGFIATALAQRLATDGRSIHVISRSALLSSLPSSITLHLGDYGNPDLLKPLASECGTVIHAASASTPGSSARHPCRELDNLLSTLRVLETIQAWPHTHVVFFSSGGALYGNASTSPIPEDTPAVPLSYYGAGKVALEGFFQAFCMFGHTTTILRPSNAYGPGQTLRPGFGLIRTLFEHARHGTTAEIWGDGENLRDFIFIDDLVEACLRVLDLPSESGYFNLGSGVGHSINSIISRVEHVTGRHLDIVYRPARRGDVRDVLLDITKAETRLAWRPKVDLDQGLVLTWDAIRRTQ